jgi:AcrR family transcriptional regulator
VKSGREQETAEYAQQTNEDSRRERRMNRRRREILVVATRLFAEVGYEATTLEMIADELALSKPGLYYYIKSKDDVLVQIHEDIVQTIIDQAEASIMPEMSPDERLWRLIVSHVVTLCSHPARRVFLLYRDQLSARTPDIIALRDRYQCIIEAAIVEGIEQGIFHVTNARLATAALLGALNWVPNWYSPQGPLSLQEIGAYFANILVGGLMNPVDRRNAPDSSNLLPNVKPGKQ